VKFVVEDFIQLRIPFSNKVLTMVLFSGCKIRRENLWLVVGCNQLPTNQPPTRGSPSVFCSQKKEPCIVALSPWLI
jgi:hypothetical protein